MNWNKSINMRYYWGQLKLKLGLITLRPWKDEPFWLAWNESVGHFMLEQRDVPTAWQIERLRQDYELL